MSTPSTYSPYSPDIPLGDEQEQDDPQSVDLIASGYEWICPKCDTLNHEIETSASVTCKECGTTWEVHEAHHAHG